MEDNEIKKKIIRGAENLFTKYGVRSISMDDIARHLSVSKKTLYQHFEDKEDIVTMAVQSHIERIMGEFDLIQSSAFFAWANRLMQTLGEPAAPAREGNPL